MSATLLDDGCPPARLVQCAAERREPGVVLFNVRKWHPAPGERFTGWLMALDQAGRLTCFYKSQRPVQGIRHLGNGNLLVTIGDGLIQEITLSGSIVRQWMATGRLQGAKMPEGAIPVETETFHHGVNLMPNGNLLILSMEVREFADWPGRASDPKAPRERARIVGDIVLEVAPDGTKLNEWRLLDILDPYRITYGSHADYWALRGHPGTYDWSHANGLAYDAQDDSLLVSLRTQDCIIKLDRTTGALRWILGAHDNWQAPWADKLLRPEGVLQWNFHQHDCSVTPAGTVLCFDNGNHRALPFAEPVPYADNFSRAVEFGVDQGARTVRQVWCHGDAPVQRVFAGFQGGAIRMPTTGNTFITYGGICTTDGVASDESARADVEARLVEVTADNQVVLDLRIGDVANGQSGYYVFRSEHVSQALALSPC